MEKGIGTCKPSRASVLIISLSMNKQARFSLLDPTSAEMHDALRACGGDVQHAL